MSNSNEPESDKAVIPLTISVTRSLLAGLEAAGAPKGKTAEEFLLSVANRALAKSDESKKGREEKPPAPEAGPDPNARILVLGAYGPRRTTIGALAEQMADVARYNSARGEIITAPDRSAGIVGGAFVEDGLADVLKACWRATGGREYPESVEEAAFGGPLFSFAAKIIVARLTGVIGPRTYDDLNVIKDIRNGFAHWATNKDDLGPLSFDVTRLRTLCEGLSYPACMGMVFADGTKLDPTSPRNKFILTTLELGEQLVGCANIVRNGMAISELKRYLP
jgi:hypothetical protein